MGFVLAPGSSWAHRLNLFAGGVGDVIQGQVYYAGQIPAPHATITIQAEQPITLQPQVDGHFSSRVVERRDYRLVAVTPDGHRAQWTVPASELAPSLPAAKGFAPSVGSTTPAPSSGAAPAISAMTTQQLETALARQIQPLREQLDRYERKIRLHDILGGLGFIVGLAGAALWWRSRQRDDNKSPQRGDNKSPQRSDVQNR